MTTALVLYGRPGCHLCTDMREQLAAWPVPLTVTEVDVDADPDLVRRYGARVPVLTAADGAELCHFFLDAAALRRHLDAA